jgi:TolB-like protein/DNA-binding winged helix-turn-helix (wHTH) protein/Tfp pilus assembly protein PilF
MSAPRTAQANDVLQQCFSVADLRINPITGEVTGPGGTETLDPKVMAVLVLLARHAGEVVLREDVLAQLWPNVVVTDDALSRCIYELRRHFSQAGGSARYRAMIETLPKRGYRLRADISRSPSTTAMEPKPNHARRFLGVATAIALAIVMVALFVQRFTGQPSTSIVASVAPGTARSIAVLPFADMSAGQDHAYLGDGISEEILNRLAQSRGLRVISRTSSFSLRDEQLDIREIATRLNVSHVLEGSVRRSANRVRITAQLIAAADNSHVWSETYDRELGDLFAIQDEIAGSVATALNVAFAGRSTHGSMPSSTGAYENFLQGEFFYGRRAPGDIERAARHYREAVELDPRYARAWAALAGAYSRLADTSDASSALLRSRQGAAARKAVALDPLLAVAHARLAQFYFETAAIEQARQHFSEALALDPNDLLVLGYAAVLAIWRGDLDQAIALQHRVVRHDPLSATQRNNLGAYLVAVGRLDDAMVEFRQALALNPSAGPEIRLEIIRILVLQGRYDEALLTLEKLPEGPLRDHGLALLHAAPGQVVQSTAALARLSAPKPALANSIPLAEVYAFRGETERAFAVLQKASLEAHQGSGDHPRLQDFQRNLLLSPFLKPLRTDRRWAALLTHGDSAAD